MLVFFFCEGEAIRMIVKSLGHPVKHWQGFVYACVDFYFSAITPVVFRRSAGVLILYE